MQVCIAIMHGNPVMLELREGVPYINDEPQPIKHLTEDDLVAFHEAVSAIPDDGDPGNVALVNAKRAAFIVDLLGHAVGDECVSDACAGPCTTTSWNIWVKPTPRTRKPAGLPQGGGLPA